MDHDYELEEDYAPRILWSRLAFFLLALVLAFVAGRACAPDGVDPDTFATEQRRVLDLQSENAVLQQQVDAAAENQNDQGAAGEDPTESGDGGQQAGGDDQATEQPVADGETYTVQPNDTLTTIAERFYGEQSKYDLIVDANNLSNDTPLRVGQELIIPEEP